MQSSLKKKIKAGRLSIPASAPSLLHAWYCSAAWALGCIGSCALLRGWADENNAFEFGSQGQGQLAVLLLAVSLATGLFHVRAYKEFQLAYVLWVASEPPDSTDSLAEAWLIVVGLLRVGWVVAVLLLGLFVLMKDGPTDAGWR
jgi:hypothetical protein